MSHASHITHPNPLVYQLLVPQTKKKTEPKTVRAGGWFASGEVEDADHPRIRDEQEADDRESDGRNSKGGRGFDATV